MKLTEEIIFDIVEDNKDFPLKPGQLASYRMPDDTWVNVTVDRKGNLHIDNPEGDESLMIPAGQ